MTPAAMKGLARRYFTEVIDGGDAAAATAILADPLLEKGHAVAAARFAELSALLHEGFPDWTTSIEAQYVDGDTVITRVVARGTHRGSYLGIPPTGQRVERGGIFLFRIEQGRIVEIWDEIDQLGLVRQLGAAIAAPASTTG